MKFVGQHHDILTSKQAENGVCKCYYGLQVKMSDKRAMKKNQFAKLASIIKTNKYTGVIKIAV